jgi:RNA polymerase sigma factor (sigma-70 family)
MTATDLELLEQFVRNHSQDAFAELVNRHVNLVYSAALRQVRSAQLAEEIAQSVFADLARNAGKLNPGTILSAWLYQVTRRTTIDVVRKEMRRQIREQIALEMNNLNATSQEWTQIEPLLDEAMDALDETDRTAILLRFFENKNLREVGEKLNISDDAAQKRVSRAVGRLQEYFTKRNVTIAASGLTVMISANAVQSAPVGLAATISAAAVLTGTAVPTSNVIATTKTIAMTTLQKALISATLITTIGTGVFAVHQTAQLRAQNQVLQQQQAPLLSQIQELQQDLNEATNRLTSLIAESANEQQQSSLNEIELLKLRAEVSRLQNDSRELPANRVALLKKKLEEMPDKKIPELRFLKEKDWLNAAWNADLDTDDGVRLALSKLRDEAVDNFFGLTRNALKKYLAANNDILPADLLSLKPYYDTQVTDDMLQRYAFMQSGKISSVRSDSVIRKTVYADPDYDSNQEMSLSGGGGGSFNRFRDAIYDAAMTYTLANNGQIPTDPSQILPDLKRPVDGTTMQKYFGEITADITANPPPVESITLAPVVQNYVSANNGQRPKKPSDLLPYITNPEQSAALQKLIQQNGLGK